MEFRKTRLSLSFLLSQRQKGFPEGRGLSLESEKAFEVRQMQFQLGSSAFGAQRLFRFLFFFAGGLAKQKRGGDHDFPGEIGSALLHREDELVCQGFADLVEVLLHRREVRGYELGGLDAVEPSDRDVLGAG